MLAKRSVAVCGATGRQGGAVARSLLAAGWKVKALTRRPNRPPARALAELGADLVTADLEKPDTLRVAFEDVSGVYSVQNGMASGFDREEAQARNVADAAKEAQVDLLVYGSAGVGEEPVGIPSWDVKRRVEAHIREIGVPFTSLRPQALMELMTDKGYYPAVGTWRIWPTLTGDDRPIPWIAAEDVGVIACAVFSDPDRYVGRALALSADVRTLGEIRSIYSEVAGRDPRTFPMPMWLFDRFTKGDVIAMWRWLRTGTPQSDTGPTRAIHPGALTVREWLTKTLEGRVSEEPAQT